MKKFYFRLVGDAFAMSCLAESKAAAKAYIRHMLGVKRLPLGTEIW